MAKRNNSYAHRASMVKVFGKICKNCGSDKNIEYHHIVPISLGGQDKIDNIVALCGKCHKAAHHGRHMSQYIDFSNSGRKRNVDKDRAFEVMDMYLHGEIGTKKCKELLGYSESCTLKNLVCVKEYMHENSIRDFKNTIDVAATTGSDGLYDGRIVGYVKYVDGLINHIFYHDTGLNDVEYVRRAQ